jgi:hypothetical protein
MTSTLSRSAGESWGEDVWLDLSHRASTTRETIEIRNSLPRNPIETRIRDKPRDGKARTPAATIRGKAVALPGVANEKTVKANMANKIARCMAALAMLTAADFGAAGARAESPVEHGKYLVGIMDCTGCHTTGALAGQPDPTHFLAGSDIGFEIPGLGIFYPPNLTSDGKTGLGA